MARSGQRGLGDGWVMARAGLVMDWQWPTCCFSIDLQMPAAGLVIVSQLPIGRFVLARVVLVMACYRATEAR